MLNQCLSQSGLCQFPGLIQVIMTIITIDGLFLTYESTNRSRLSQLGLLGLKLINLLNMTWATGAIPMGAPGWPELALKVASTYKEGPLSAFSVPFAQLSNFVAVEQQYRYYKRKVGQDSRHTASKRMVLMASSSS